MSNAVYMPILRGLRGENWALRDQGYRQEIYPVVQIPRRKWDLEQDKPERSLEEHIDSFQKWCGFRSALQSIGGCAVDGVLLESYEPDDSSESLDRISSSALRLGVPIVPATGFDRAPGYDETVRSCHAQHAAGVLIRANREDLYDYQDLKAKIDGLLGQIRVGPREVDFCCDLGALSEAGEQDDLQMLLAVLPDLPYLDRWRSLWFAGGSFPETLGEVDKESTAYLPRVEWAIWTEIRRQHMGSRLPMFGDYGVYHPISPVPSTTRNMSTNIRYATSDYWMIIKGKSVRAAGHEDYYARCAILVSSQEYSGRSFSPGDLYFDDRASEIGGPGNASNWRSADTSHHMAYVTEQVLKLQSLR